MPSLISTRGIQEIYLKHFIYHLIVRACLRVCFVLGDFTLDYILCPHICSVVPKKQTDRNIAKCDGTVTGRHTVDKIGIDIIGPRAIAGPCGFLADIQSFDHIPFLHTES